MDSLRKDAVLDAESIQILIDFVKSQGLPTQSYKKGEVILHEKTENKHLYVILGGMVELTRTSRDSNAPKIIVDVLGPGSFLGLISFWSGRLTLSKSVAIEAVECLVFTPKSFDQVRQRFSGLSQTVDHLLIGNLCERVQRMAHLNTENAELTIALNRERDQLANTLKELEETRERLAHSERLAVMGELVAGIAHEINNPAAALRQSIEGIQNAAETSLFSKQQLRSQPAARAELFEVGLHGDQPDSATIRSKLKFLDSKYSDLPRSLKRRLAYMPDNALDLVASDLKELTKKGSSPAFNESLSSFEMGAFMQTAQLTTERIFELVKSLKRYGRRENKLIDDVDIVTCIQDTRMVLNHRLRNYELKMDLQELPRIRIVSGELNQVITNLLVNAMDATPERGHITISCHQEKPWIIIQVRDSGTGIAPENMTRLFEPSFTTKNSSQHFGLGMGLALSKEIIEQYGGTIKPANNDFGGACFTVMLPETTPQNCK